MGGIGSPPVWHVGGRGVSGCHDYSDDGGGASESGDCHGLLGCSPATVDNVRQRYRQRGLVGLRRGTPPGRRSRATAAYRTALRQALQTPPAQWGYGFSVWSVARVGQHLKKTTGVGFSEDHLRRLVHAEGFSFQRPKHTLKGKRDEVAYEYARQELQGLKKKPSPRKRTLC